MKYLLAFLLVSLTNCSELGSAYSGLSESEVVAGLKEALSIGTGKTVQTLSQENAYYRDPEIKIPFPSDARQVETTLRDLGLGSLVEQVIVTLNRAAEDAAPAAKEILLGAVTALTIQDAFAILHGEKDEATQFLRRNTYSGLVGAFQPKIQTSLDRVDATKYWGQAIDTYNQIPFVDKVNPDLAGFVTAKALDGLFTWLAKEEALIRTDPAARITDLLRRVFQ